MSLYKIYLSICKIKVMSKSSICEAEERRLEKLYKFQLPNSYKKIGWGIVIATFILMLTRKIFDIDAFWVKEVLRYIFLVGFLMISVSKEKLEDEYIESLRAKSYRAAFILTVLYALVQPYVNYIVDFILDKTPNNTSEFSYFQLLCFMLIVQIGFFVQLKRTNS